MPTLFNKDDILNGEEREETIYFSKLYEIPEGVEDPYITIKINDDTREKQRKAFKKFVAHRIVSRGDNHFQVVSPDKVLEYVMEMLRVSMIKTEHLIDDASFPVMRKMLSRSNYATKFLANEITEAFDKDAIDLRKQEDEDEKNL